jgi:hypothetical protein
MYLRRLLTGAVAVALLAPFAAPAAASSSNKTRAVRAVRAELKNHYSGFSPSDVSCVGLTSRRFKCSYVGFARGEDGPCRGTARATVYPGAVDVTSVSKYHCDF